jgi:hypothetical protein
MDCGVLHRMLRGFDLRLSAERGPRTALGTELIDRVAMEVPISIRGRMERQLRNPCRLGDSGDGKSTKDSVRRWLAHAM